MTNNTFSEIILTMNCNDLVEMIKSDQRFNRTNLSKLTIEEMGNRLLPEIVDGEGVSYAAWPKYWEQFKNEFMKLICTSDKKYQSLRKELLTAANKSHTTIVSSIAAVMASQFGVTAGVLVPFCALLLIAIIKVGIETFCACASLDVFIE